MEGGYMTSRKFFIPFVLFLTLTAALFAQKAPAGSPVARYGQLKVIGTKICDIKGNPVVLKGMSTSGLQWYGDLINPDAFTSLAKDWKTDVIRLALYVGENGYASQPKLKDLVKKGIELAVANGIYVIVDWHVLNPGDPNDPVYAGAPDFFKEIASQYGRTPNVIYEIMNEPNGSLSWQTDLKPYAEKMVNVIRAIDPDNIILIGSGTWSQDVDTAASHPVAGTNLAYTVHFYAGTHGKILQRKIQKALAKGVAVYASEWGTSLATGDGGPFIDKSEAWLKFLADHEIGWTNWSLCNRNETSAAFKKMLREYVEGKGTITTQKETPLYPTISVKGGYKIWPQDQLTISGAYVRAKLRGEPIPTDVTAEGLRDAVAGPEEAADPGKFQGLPWNFEDGTRQGWTVPADSGGKVKAVVLTAESRALAFTYGWTRPGPADPMTVAPRLSSSWVNLKAADYKTLSFDLYIQSGKATHGALKILPVIQSPQHSYWFELTPRTVSAVKGRRLSNGLLKYTLSFELNNNGTTFKKGDSMRNLIFITIGLDTDYDGNVYYDNITFK